MPAHLSRRPNIRHPTVESQRIGHFLSSLPEEPSGYESASGAHLEHISKTLEPSKRNQTLPTFNQQYIKRSRSQEELLTPSHLLAEESDNDQFSGVTNSKLVHYASDSALNLALAMSRQTLRETTADLKAFAATTSSIKFSSDSEILTPKQGLTGCSKDSSIDPKAMTDSSPEQSIGRYEVPARDVPSVRPRSSSLPKPARLGTYLESFPEITSLKGVPKTRRRRWESATTIMERILDDKISEAPTSVMSVNTRAKLSSSRPLLRWNDTFYGYLPSYVATGNVGAVRAMLTAGCNPGTAEKPRWAPIYNAIRGATNKHTKCLRALVSHGVNVNAVRSTNGRRPLHYAIEKAPWSGYSSVIYTLLAAHADPNARDNANYVPLLMLLAGKGPLSKEKRDALYLLLAPNFATDLDVFSRDTLDNPLHLAIHRKDAYTVDVVLEKMKQVQGRALSLLHKQNGSGFTPLLLAFTIFKLLGEEADEELQIIKLLLEHGANPNDQNVSHGETPLHLVVQASKNTIALELLCRHSANATLPSNAGQSAIDVAHRTRFEHPKDKWYLFAKRRMLNILKENHYRPQELMAFLEEEASPDTKDKTDNKKVDNVDNKKVATKKMTVKKMGDRKDENMNNENKRIGKNVDHNMIDGKKVEDKKINDAPVYRCHYQRGHLKRRLMRS